MRRLFVILLVLINSLYAIDTATDKRIKALERSIGKIQVMVTEPNKANLVPGEAALYTTATHEHRLYINYGDSVKYFDIDEIAAATAGLLAKQDDADTSSTDATRYWVTTTAIANKQDDSDTTTFDATQYDLTTAVANKQDDSDTTTFDATQYDLTTAIATKQDDSDTTTFDATQYDLTTAIATKQDDSDTTTFDATQYDVTIAVINKQDDADTSSTDATRYWTVKTYNGIKYYRNADSLAAFMNSGGFLSLEPDCTITLTSATYDLNIPNGTRLEGTPGTLIDWTKVNTALGRHLFYFINQHDLIIDGFKIDQNGVGSNDQVSDDAMLFINCYNITIRNLEISNSAGDGSISLYGCRNVLVDNVTINMVDTGVGSKAYTCITIGSGSAYSPANSRNIRIANSNLTGGTHSVIDIENSTANTYSIEDVFIENCKLRKSNGSQSGLQIYGGNIRNIHVANTSISNCDYGVYITYQSTDGYVKNLQFTNVNIDSCGYGFISNGAEYVDCNNVTVRQITNDGFNIVNGNHFPQQSTFTNCRATKCGTGFYIDSANSMMFNACSADSNTTYGFRVDANYSYANANIQLNNCNAGYNGAHGLYISGQAGNENTRITVNGGSYFNNGDDGINVNESDYTRIVGATCDYNTSDGIYISNSNECFISEAACRANGGVNFNDYNCTDLKYGQIQDEADNWHKGLEVKLGSGETASIRTISDSGSEHDLLRLENNHLGAKDIYILVNRDSVIFYNESKSNKPDLYMGGVYLDAAPNAGTNPPIILPNANTDLCVYLNADKLDGYDATAFATATAIRDSLDVYRTFYKLDTTKVDTAQWGKFVRDHEATGLSFATVASAIGDSLNPYRTAAFKWDTTKIDTAQWGKFVRDHEATGLLFSAVAAAIGDSLNPYRTAAFKLDTTKIDTAQWGNFVRDHQSTSGGSGSGDIEGVTAGWGISGGGTSGTVTVAVDTAAGKVATAYDLTSGLAGKVSTSGNESISGVKTFSDQAAFTNIIKPFTVTGSTVVTNLNADLLDGYSSSSFEPAFTTLPVADGGTGATSYTASQLIRMNSGGTAFESSGLATTAIVQTTGNQSIAGTKTFTGTITSGVTAPGTGADMAGNSIVGVRDLWHDEGTAGDFHIYNKDADKSIILGITGAGETSVKELFRVERDSTVDIGDFASAKQLEVAKTGNVTVRGNLSVLTDMIFVGVKTGTYAASQGHVWISGDTLFHKYDASNSRFWLKDGTSTKH